MTNALSLIMPLEEAVAVHQLLGMISQSQDLIDQALNGIGTVHDARFVLFDRSQPDLQPVADSSGPFALGVFTTYDGSFEAYIQDFTRSLAPVFDALLSVTADGKGLVPVKDHAQEFVEWIGKHDAAQQHPNNRFEIYTAYPYTVQQILAAGS